jgi:hypothetical protein
MPAAGDLTAAGCLTAAVAGVTALGPAMAVPLVMAMLVLMVLQIALRHVAGSARPGFRGDPRSEPHICVPPQRWQRHLFPLSQVRLYLR